VIVLDTHAWLWWMASDRRLSETGRLAIEASDEIGVPAICCWELALLVARERLKLAIEPLEWINDALSMGNVRLLPLLPEVAVLANTACNQLHRDPADRIIVATALHLGAPLVTADERIRRANLVRTIW
jgi:PIN domain nuclease of toxin-antitoxin system